MRAFVAEAIGSLMLVTAVVGSGIMGERLAGGNAAMALLANSLATGAVLVTLIFTFGSISGAHFNPAVSVALAAEGGFPWRAVPVYVLAQSIGALAGVLIAHAMFALPLLQLSTHARVGGAQMFSEFVATFGLLVVVHGSGEARRCRSADRGRVHHRGLLVHREHEFREPRSHSGARIHEHVQRNSTGECRRIHCRATGGRDRGDAAVPLASAQRAPAAAGRSAPASVNS